MFQKLASGLQGVKISVIRNRQINFLKYLLFFIDLYYFCAQLEKR